MTQVVEEDAVVTIAGLNTRLTALEQLVHQEILPMQTENNRLTAVISAQSDEMYAAFVEARNFVRVMARVGNGFMWCVENGRKIGAALFWLSAGAGTLMGAIHSSKIADWVVSKLL